MSYLEAFPATATPHLGVVSTSQPQGPRGVVHLVDNDHDARGRLGDLLARVGLTCRTYDEMGEFLSACHDDVAGCVVLDAQTLTGGGFASALGYPVVLTAYHADVAMAVRAMKTGAVDFVEKPFRERDILVAVGTAIETHRLQRLRDARRDVILARFATLTPRERQVMALVTAGKMNKQAAGDLGLSEITVKAHRGSAMRKMCAKSLADLVRMADVVGGEGLAAS